MSILIELKHRDTGKTLFSSTNDGNTTAKCLRLAHLLKHDVRQVDLSESDLSHGHFVGIDLTGADLRNSILDGANFHKAVMDAVNFSCDAENPKRTSAIGANFQEAKLHRVCAKGVNFTGAWFNDAMSMEGNFEHSVFDKATVLNFMTRGSNFKKISTVGTISDETDTRINYKWQSIEVPVVCEGECQHCAGCESPKKLGEK